MGAGASCCKPTDQELFVKAVVDGDAFAFSTLLGEGAAPGEKKPKVNVRQADEHGFTPLHIAAEKNHFRLVKELLARGALLDARTESGFTPVGLAAKSGANESCILLLNAGAAIDSADTAFGCTALMWAAQNCDDVTVAAMCASRPRPDFELRNRFGLTTLIVTVEANRASAVRAMIDAGARVRSPLDSKGRSAVAAAREKKASAAVLDALLEADAREERAAEDARRTEEREKAKADRAAEERAREFAQQIKDRAAAAGGGSGGSYSSRRLSAGGTGASARRIGR